MSTVLEPSRAFADEVFTLRPSASGGFGAVEAALARKLAQLATRPERIAVIVVLEDWRQANLFTQTLVDRDDGAWVEAVSNTYIESPEHQLGNDQHRLLRELGFDPPDDGVSPNHHRVFDQPTDWSTVAALLIRTMEAVYGASPHCELRVAVSEVGRPGSDDQDSEAPAERTTGHGSESVGGERDTAPPRPGAIEDGTPVLVEGEGTAAS